jgi:hypothetical protein
MAKKHTTKKCGPSRRPRKKTRTLPQCEYKIHEKLRDTFLKISNKKGETNQERFERIFSGDFMCPYWFLGIRKATEHEDLFEGTDYFVITDGYGDIRFDVKSSFINFEKQKKEQKGKPIFVWVIVIKLHMSDEDIRRALYKKCETHIARVIREAFSERSNLRTA